MRSRWPETVMLAAALAWFACVQDDRPVAGPAFLDDARAEGAAEVVDGTDPGAVRLVQYAAPSESLFVYEPRPDDRIQLLFYSGRGVEHDREGRSYVPDLEGGRVLVVDDRLQVVRTIGGPGDGAGGIGLPLSVAATESGAVFVVDVEHPKGLLYYEPSGRFRGASRPPVLNGSVRGGPGNTLWAARSPYIYGFDPTEPHDPLLFRFDPLAGEGTGIATVEPVRESRWNRLANAGSVAVGPDGTAYFAFLLRNELRAYRPDGSLVWRVGRQVPFETHEPEIETADAEVRLELRPVTQALAVGGDGPVYALTASDSVGSGSPDAVRRLEAYDPEDGRLVRAATVPAAWSTFGVDEQGRAFRVDPTAIAATAPPAERMPLPSAAFESFAGEPASFDDYRGKALLVNIWASWCVPCRQELPQLAVYYETLDKDRVEFLAISDDTDPAAARHFAAGLDLPYPLFLGLGRMVDRLGYVALPYTMIVDYRGRVVEEIYGFGSARTWTRLQETLEREMERAAPPRSAVGTGMEDRSGHGHARTEPDERPGHGHHEPDREPRDTRRRFPDR